MATGTKVREGVKANSLPLFISRKNTPRVNIFVGNEAVHIEHAQRELGLRCTTSEKTLTDDDLLSAEPLLFQVFHIGKLDLSPNVRQSAGIWAADPIVKGSAFATALVKRGMQLIGLDSKTVDRGEIQRIADQIAKEGVQDVRAAFWRAAHLLLDPPEDYTLWRDPWTAADWLSPQTNVTHRLHAIYRTLVGWSYVVQSDAVGAKKFGVTPSQQNAYRQMTLDRRRVFASICLLSKWKNSGMSPYVCALRLTWIWNRSK